MFTFKFTNLPNNEICVYRQLEMHISQLISVMQGFRRKFYSADIEVSFTTTLSDSHLDEVGNSSYNAKYSSQMKRFS